MKSEIGSCIKPLLFVLLLFCVEAGQAQDENTSIKSAIESRRFAFDAQTVTPAAGRTRQIAGERYSIRVSGDSLVSELPYFGRAFSAPLSGGGGIRFTSVKYNYAIKNRKRGGWDIELQPGDVTDLRKFVLTVFENGSATLRALSNNRQPISFNGTVHAVQ